MPKRWTAPPGSPLAQLRQQCHASFDVLWEFEILPRRDVYRKLARHMGLPESECHFGMFDEAQCQQALALRDKVTPS